MITAKEVLGPVARKLGVRIDSAQSLRKVERHIASTFYGIEIGQAGEVVTAYVNEYRWVITCPACNAGINVTPGFKESACMECGRVHRVTFPSADEMAEAERLLRARPLKHRNWFPSDVTIAGSTFKRERISDLRDENAVLIGGER